ncbi:uncharacterized protein [Drosophila virilis]|uniref:Uncharacterized protein n=1 Tax=Drosophila virilis TaxID=7244 RepID=B4MA63_DROVI|nr:uncharacterized protein LOC6634833 [Drosophila virilis]EDW66122.1 uncharacterized protein Dvir_GJ15724 [Drosophila virilis]
MRTTKKARVSVGGTRKYYAKRRRDSQICRLRSPKKKFIQDLKSLIFKYKRTVRQKGPHSRAEIAIFKYTMINDHMQKDQVMPLGKKRTIKRSQANMLKSLLKSVKRTRTSQTQARIFEEEEEEEEEEETPSELSQKLA